MGSQFDNMTPQEINFITHPMWRIIEEHFKEDPNAGFVVEQHGEPVAVIVDYNIMERLKHDLETLQRSQRRRRRNGR